MKNALRDGLKRGAAQAMAGGYPTARYDRMILVLSHMRSATTAMSNVLCSHEAVAGYGETHVPHDAAHAPGQVAVNLALRRALPLSAKYLFDKVLHTHLDVEAPRAFYDAKALFLVRHPSPSILSIQKLAEKTGMETVSTPEGAALYYAERLERLAVLWDSFRAENRLGLSAEHLLENPDERVPEIGEWLGLRPSLENAYKSHKATQKGGGGDPTQSAKHTRIEARPMPATLAPIIGVPDALAEKCFTAHEALVGRFS
ncbi:MAG: sulfotransferase [Sulfitobacter sp.]